MIRAVLILAAFLLAAIGCQGNIGPGSDAPGGGRPGGGLGGGNSPGGGATTPGGGAVGGGGTTPGGGAVGGGATPGDPTGVGPGTPVDEAVRKQRVDAGFDYYTSTSCVICHGNDGRKTVGNGKSLLSCESCGSWDSLRAYIDKTMPPEAGPQFGPDSCDAECAARTADWIWNVVNGWRLTAQGGSRPDKVAGVAGQDTRRIKPYAALQADFLRVFGKVPASLEASAGAFRATPRFFYENASLGAVTLNVLANAAVEACGGETMPALETEPVRAKCAEWAQRMWLRAGTPAELQSCVDTAMVTTRTLSPPRKRLDFACASMMLSIPALTF